MSYYPVLVTDGVGMVLLLEPMTLAKAQSQIAGQRRLYWPDGKPRGHEDWRIASVKDGYMVDQSGNRLRLDRSTYAVEAWEAFLSREGLIDPDSIVSRIRADRQGGAGDLLTMGDGSVWFHPYSGASPVKER